MSQQPAAFYPPHYTIWYEHAAGMNPELSRVLGERLTTGAMLTDADIVRLHAQYVLARDTAALQHLEERFQVLVEKISNAAANAGADASKFGQSLEEHTIRLKQPIAADRLQELVAELLADTRHMCLVTSDLSQQLERSTGEIRTLTRRLEQAQSEALRDPLTGLYNRRGFDRAVEQVARDAAGLEGAALLVIDIDHFKRVNDDHGHLLGDQVLRAIARILSGDEVRDGIPSRLGGEEFAVFLHSTESAAALEVAEQIRAAVARLHVRRGRRRDDLGNVTVSIGVASAGPAETLEMLLERADAALYAAKRSGRNRVARADVADTQPHPGDPVA
ncbi:MAG: GGDEF domain-containing protein [Steroidobacteraceae bacterium]